MLVINGMTARVVGRAGQATPDSGAVLGAYTGPILLTHEAHDGLATAERIQALRPDSRLSV